MKILIVSQSFAEWGGLQEWVSGLSVNLLRLGHDIGLVTSSAEISSRVANAGGSIFEVDWTFANEQEILQQVGFDWEIVLTTPLKSRAVGIAISEAIKVPCIATFHGVYADYVYSWKSRISKIVPVAPALAGMIKMIGAVDDGDLVTIPNGIPSDELRTEAVTYKERMADGDFTIAMASRLEGDKIGTLSVLGNLLPKLQLLGFEDFQLVLMGDGRERGLFESRLRSMQRTYPGFKYELAGWVDSSVMCSVMSTAMATVGGGRTALHSLACSTPVIGSGARAFVGVSSVRRLQSLLDCNFGDYIPDRNLATFDDLDLFENPATFEDAGRTYRKVIGDRYTDELVAARFADLCLDLTGNSTTLTAE